MGDDMYVAPPTKRPSQFDALFHIIHTRTLNGQQEWSVVHVTHAACQKKVRNWRRLIMSSYPFESPSSSSSLSFENKSNAIFAPSLVYIYASWDYHSIVVGVPYGQHHPPSLPHSYCSSLYIYIVRDGSSRRENIHINDGTCKTRRNFGARSPCGFLSKW